MFIRILIFHFLVMSLPCFDVRVMLGLEIRWIYHLFSERVDYEDFLSFYIESIIPPMRSSKPKIFFVGIF